jgi:O-antigen ligase
LRTATISAVSSLLREASLSLPIAFVGLSIGAALVATAVRIGGNDAPVLLLASAVAPVLVIAILTARIVGVFFVLALFPIGSVVLPVPVLAVQTVEIAVLMVAALVIISRIAQGLVPLAWASPLWWALALFGWALAATLSAGDLTLALKQDVMLLLGIVFACVVLAALETMDDVRRMLGMLVTVCVGVAIVAMSSGVHLSGQFGGEVVGGRLTGAFNHPNQLGLFSAIGIVVATGLAFGARTRTERIAAAASIPIILVPLVLSLSRGAWIGCGLAFVYLLIALREARRALVVLAIPVIVAAYLVGSFAPGKTEIQVVGERARAITTLSPYDGRPAIYAEAEREIKNNPLVGVGPGNFPVAAQRAGSEAVTVYPEHAHNLWLTWAVEGGIPAAAMIAGLVIALALVVRRASRVAVVHSRRDRAVIAGIVAALITVLGQGFVDYLLRNAVLWMDVWGLIGALLVCTRVYGNERPETVSATTSDTSEYSSDTP